MRALNLAIACSIAGSIAGLGAERVHAAQNGFYVGAATGEARTRHDTGLGDIFDDRDSSSKLIVGWRPVDWFAVEGSYFDLGDITLRQPVADLTPFRLEQRGYGAFAVVLKEIANFDLFAKAGIVNSSADLTVNTIAGPVTSVDKDTDLAWGAGAQVRFGRVAARIEYERFEISNGDGFKPPKVVSLGVTWTF